MHGSSFELIVVFIFVVVQLKAYFAEPHGSVIFVERRIRKRKSCFTSNSKHISLSRSDL